MAKRTVREQNEHDRVVKASANTYPGKVYTNPDGEKNMSVKGLYPDVVAKRNGYIIIEEVETASSVNAGEKEQWKAYASLGYTFRLIVPYAKVSEAQRLTRNLKIDKLQWYAIRDGQIRFGDA